MKELSKSVEIEETIRNLQLKSVKNAYEPSAYARAMSKSRRERKKGVIEIINDYL